MKERERQRETQWDRESHGCQWMINKSSAYSTVNHQNALNGTRTSRFQLSIHTCSPTSTKRHTDTQKYAYKRPHCTLTRWHVQGSRYTSYSLVPSSETIPRPSALFCLSNAFRSRTLSTGRDVNSLLKELMVPGTSKRLVNLQTCRSASGTECWGRIPRPSYPSGSPAFSAHTEGRKHWAPSPV